MRAVSPQSIGCRFPVFADDFVGMASYPEVSLRSTPGYLFAMLSRASHDVRDKRAKRQSEGR